MPYYFGEDSPGWDEYMERLEAENLARGPFDRFTYVEPYWAQASVLRFSGTPRTSLQRKGRPGIIARMFGSKAPGGPKHRARIEIGSPEALANFHAALQAAQKRNVEELLEGVAVWAAALRAAGVRKVLVRTIGEQHVVDDLGWIPSVKDWLQHLQPQPWMGRSPFRPQESSDDGRPEAVTAPTK